jgi:hypothetical protein
MINLPELPPKGIFGKDVEESFEKKVMTDLTNQGRSSYKAGIPIEKCPQFRVHDMSIQWQMGWRWAKEEHDQNKTKK